jgi:toxin ParE1/3/4
MEVRWLDDALADVAEIYRYVAADDVRAAARVVESIQAAVRRLNDAPHHGRPGRWPGTRELVVPRTPYIVPYRVAGDLVEIPRCLPLAAGGTRLTATQRIASHELSYGELCKTPWS